MTLKICSFCGILTLRFGAMLLLPKVRKNQKPKMIIKTKYRQSIRHAIIQQMAQKSVRILFKGVLIVLVVSAAFYFALLARENGMVKELVRGYGYYGIFAVAVISGFNFAVPVPAVAFLPLFLEPGLNFWLAVILIALGTTFADAFAYLVGRFGRQIVELNSK